MHELGIFKRYNRRRRKFTWPPFCVEDSERLLHTLILGKTGMGKSTLMHNSILQDIRAGRGCIVIDPKGDLALDLLRTIPPKRRPDVIYFNPADLDYPIPYNPVDYVEPRKRSQTANRILAAFHHLFRDSWGPQLAQILKNALLVVLSVRGGSLADVNLMLTDKDHRAQLLKFAFDNPMLQRYWYNDFEKRMSEKEQKDRTLSTLNKIGQFLTDPMLYNIIRHPSAFDLTAIMDEGKIFIANLDQGKMGEEASALLGGLLISSIHSAALSRERRDPFMIYVDEFYLFGAGAFPRMLAILRGFGVGLVLACQYLDQLEESLQRAVLGSAGTLIALQIGVRDAEILTPLFRLTREDTPLYELPAHAACIRTTTRTAEVLIPPCLAKTYIAGPDRIIARCRREFAPRNANRLTENQN